MNKKITIPYWNEAEGVYKYKGTLSELESEDLLVTIKL